MRKVLQMDRETKSANQPAIEDMSPKDLNT
jgi:hypothetical protein